MANVYAIRENGIWKIQVELDNWMINDILHDATSGKRALVSLYPKYNSPGLSLYDPDGYSGKRNQVVAMVLFEETNLETKE